MLKCDDSHHLFLTRHWARNVVSWVLCIYSWPMNSVGLYCAGPFICRCFTVNTTVLHGWIWMQRNHRYRRPAISYMRINLHVVQGSAVLVISKLMLAAMSSPSSPPSFWEIVGGMTEKFKMFILWLLYSQYFVCCLCFILENLYFKNFMTYILKNVKKSLRLR